MEKTDTYWNRIVGQLQSVGFGFQNFHYHVATLVKTADVSCARTFHAQLRVGPLPSEMELLPLPSHEVFSEGFRSLLARFEKSNLRGSWSLLGISDGSELRLRVAYVLELAEFDRKAMLLFGISTSDLDRNATHANLKTAIALAAISE